MAATAWRRPTPQARTVRAPAAFVSDDVDRLVYGAGLCPFRVGCLDDGQRLILGDLGWHFQQHTDVVLDLCKALPRDPRQPLGVLRICIRVSRRVTVLARAVCRSPSSRRATFTSHNFQFRSSARRTRLCRAYRRVQPTTALRRPHSPPAESIAAPGDWDSRCNNAVIITVAGGGS